MRGTKDQINKNIGIKPCTRKVLNMKEIDSANTFLALMNASVRDIRSTLYIGYNQIVIHGYCNTLCTGYEEREVHINNTNITTCVFTKVLHQSMKGVLGVGSGPKKLRTALQFYKSIFIKQRRSINNRSRTSGTRSVFLGQKSHKKSNICWYNWNVRRAFEKYNATIES